MRSPRSKHAARLHVAIVSGNPETLDGLEMYLQNAGATTTGSRNIERSARIGAGATAVVVFPDDFDWDAVVAALTACVRTNPTALPLVVTSAPQRFDSVTWPEDGATLLIVPKPAWGWTILDAIRAHSPGDPNEPESHP